ncbi:MAG: hypothetical protein HWE16_00985 [Gammaproteobacteria bacterium]|nr:hypothetical protein [Gammaproteobacteria bacterium]
MTFKKHSFTLNRALKSFATVAASVLILSACKTAPVQEPVKVAPPPPPKPVKTYKTVNIGTNNYMTLPSNWNLKSGFMPKGYVRYTVKGKGVHMVITGFQSAKSKFSSGLNRKELDSKTLLYWSSASNRQKTYLPLTNHHRIGEYVQYHCKTGTKCYQVFPLSSWSSVIVSEFQAGDMKYNITAGVNGLNSVAAQDVIKGLISIEPQ